jgi:hypothetical protein
VVLGLEMYDIAPRRNFNTEGGVVRTTPLLSSQISRICAKRAAIGFRADHSIALPTP